jgi:hypothetical protein
MRFADVIRLPFEDPLWNQWFWPVLFNLLLIIAFIVISLAAYE